jgi:hypothetical protein
MQPVELKMNEDEVKILSDLHKRAQEIVFTIGQTEVRKDTLLGQLREINRTAQGKMDAAAERLGIPQGTPWQMMPDGTILLLDAETGNPLPTP